MKYWEPEPHERAYLERELDSADGYRIVHALIEAAYHDPDWKWVQRECKRFSFHEDSNVRYAATICLGHLARLHRQLDEVGAKEMLVRLAQDSDEQVRTAVRDTRCDLHIFLRRRRRMKIFRSRRLRRV